MTTASKVHDPEKGFDCPCQSRPVFVSGCVVEEVLSSGPAVTIRPSRAYVEIGSAEIWWSSLLHRLELGSTRWLVLRHRSTTLFGLGRVGDVQFGVLHTFHLSQPLQHFFDRLFLRQSDENPPVP